MLTQLYSDEKTKLLTKWYNSAEDTKIHVSVFIKITV